MGALWRVIEWIGLILGAAVAALALIFLLARRRILRRVTGGLAGERLLLAAGAHVGEYGGRNGKTPAPGATGILMLFASGLYFRSWLGSREVFVSGPAISWIGVADRSDTQRGERHRIVVRFLNAAGKEGGSAIRLLSPEQWVEAIKTHLISRSS